jgi:RNA polymerase sigma-70 factor, ECF subfamily
VAVTSENPIGLLPVVFRRTAIDLGDRHQGEIDMYNTETAAVDGTAACARFAPSPSARHDMADATLIARIATGDRLAMHALFARHKTRVYRFILRLVGDAASADDLTSEVFLTVWRHAHKFRGRAAASTWLLAIARFKALDELRRRRDAAPDLEQPDASDPAADPEASWADKHRGAMLRKCLGALSPEHRTIIDLVYYHEKSVQEVAAIVGIPCATVKTRMFYARKKLAALLAAERVTGAVARSRVCGLCVVLSHELARLRVKQKPRCCGVIPSLKRRARL